MASRGLSGWVKKLLTAPGRLSPGIAVGGPGDLGDGPLYARGFLLAGRELVAPAAVAGWRPLDLPGHVLHVDPRVPVHSAQRGNRSAWLIGDAFEPIANVYDDAAGYLLEGDLLERLDGMAGRFALIVHGPGNRLEVYHDAMGARSVFYGAGVVASHAGLIAEMLGTGLREWIIPFITSRGYFQRDVKYLPGLDSPFEEVRQLTPNTRLSLPDGGIARYWPRAPHPPTDVDTAVDSLVVHMQGLRAYLSGIDGRAFVGLSAGRDSRCALAALVPLEPHLFTFVRSKDGRSENSADSRTARRLAEAAGLPLEIVKLTSPPHLNTAASAFAKAFRRNTGYIRGNNAGWVEHFWKQSATPLPASAQDVFVRGFGGEVMRGFYKPMAGSTPALLADTYGVNAGSSYSRQAFATFRDVVQWPVDLLGYGPEDLLYWEHRMGVWGSSAFSESDMAFRGMPAFNSRRLFQNFMALPPDARGATSTFDAATTRLFPGFDGISYVS